MGATLQVQKISNSGFEHWRDDTANTYPHPYEWGDDDGFGSIHFVESTAVVHSGSSSLLATNVTSVASLFSTHFIPIINDATHTYTIDFWYYLSAYETPDPNFVALREYDEDMTNLVPGDVGIRYFGAGSLARWINHTSTIGGVGSGADHILDADCVGIDFYIYHRGTSGSLMYFDEFQLFGESITLSKGFNWPVDSSDALLQKAALTGAGDVLAATEYGTPLRRFTLDFSRVQSDDYDALYGFLTSPDINYLDGTFELTDDAGDTYFGKFVQTTTGLRGDFYQGISGTFEFRELPY